MGTVESFVRLFRGRGDQFGAWGKLNPDTGKRGGGCIHKPLTVELMERHLYSHQPDEWLGVYNVVDTRCSWGVVDIDFDDVALALRIRDALAHEDVPAWVERTTHGYHVWVFPDRLVEADIMRRALQGACLVIGYSPREVFPKQVRATVDNPGNYVRLPLNGSLANPAPRDVRRFIHKGVTLHDMDRHRAALPDLERLASTVVSPQPVDISVDTEGGLEVQWDVEAIGGLALRLWRDGPQGGRDRSHTLVWLGHELCRADAEPSLAFRILRSADQRWGKFSDRGQYGVEMLRKIVSQAYA